MLVRSLPKEPSPIAIFARRTGGLARPKYVLVMYGYKEEQSKNECM